MSNRRRLELLLRSKFRSAGQQYEEAMRTYNTSKNAAISGLPTDEEGRVRIVCRRHAEKRSVDLDEQGRPHCFDPDHQDCQGCVEDIHDGRIETW
jgi:type II secretory pathway pseudopilin PulG